MTADDLYRWLPRSLDLVFGTLDCTFKSLDDARGVPDFVALHLWALTGPDLYLLPWEFHQQVGVVETINAVFAARGWATTMGLPLTGVHVEDKANGPAVIQLLRQKVPGVAPWPHPDASPAMRRLAASSKESRARAASVYVAAGNVHVPSPEIAPWVDGWLAEVEGYPLAAFDDRVDGLSMATAIAFLDQEQAEARDYWKGWGSIKW